MTKIMLVEDDNNLREIYEARLSAEGYDIVSAHDGEAALAMASKERPDLIITDVMMPKISGFEMLDILRNTANLRDVKVIMLTALGQAEDNARANALGADRYLVKSQVTLEDIVKAAHEVLEDTSTPATGEEAAVSDQPDSDVRTWQPTAPEASTPNTAAIEPDAPHLEVVQPAESAAAMQLDLPNVPVTPDAEDVPHTNSYLVGDNAAAAAPVVPQVTPDDTTATSDDTPSANDAVASPPVEPTDGSDTEAESRTGIDNQADPEIVENPQAVDQPAAELLTPEEAADQPDIAAAEPAAQEESDIREQIEDFLDTNTDPEVAPAPDAASEQPEVVTPPAEQAAQPEVVPAPNEPTVTEQPAIADQPADEYEKDDNTPDMGRLSVHGEAPPADEDESEYEKDAATPDMGQMEVHEETVVPAVQSEPPAQDVSLYPTESDSSTTADVTPADIAPSSGPTPGYPSQPYELPVMPGGALSDSVVSQQPQAATEPQQSSGDKVVSDAINDMIASTTPSSPQTSEPVLQPEPPLVTTPASVPPTSDQAAETSQPNDAQGKMDENSDSATHRRVISPLGTSIRPDINQLLAMEDAKAAAIQAGSSPQPSPESDSQPSQPQTGQGWQPLPVQEQPRRDVYGPGIDPNSISL